MASVSSRRDALPPRSPIILLVDSHQDTCEMYAEYLRMYGFSVHTVGTTDEGWRQASEADVIVTGIRVHGSFDGLELIDRLRHAESTKDTPIIVVSACAFGTDQQHASAAGCNVFLSKPCLPEQLVDAIHAVEPPTTLKR